jgi:hypothetical protein
MIKIQLTRDELEIAVQNYIKDEVLDPSLLRNNDIRITQGKSASATVLVIPKTATKEDTLAAMEEASDEIEAVSGQPDVPEPVTTTTMFE